jgi:hypothetical protein
MNNLEELIKTADKLKYTKSMKCFARRNALNILGRDTYLVLCIEELGELVEVVATNAMNKTEYIHTAEELVDVYICMDIMKTIYGISDKQLDKLDKHHVKASKSIVLSSIADLSNMQQIISKTIRAKSEAKRSKAFDKILPQMNIIYKDLYIISKYFNIKKKDINRIEALKYQRLVQRITLGTLE